MKFVFFRVSGSQFETTEEMNDNLMAGAFWLFFFGLLLLATHVGLYTQTDFCILEFLSRFFSLDFKILLILFFFCSPFFL